MPFHPPPALPRFIADELPLARGSYELMRGPDAGREIHFVDEGDKQAPAVLMLHGNPTWSYLWRKVIAALPGYRRVAPDLLGLGMSSRLPRVSDHGIDRHADAIAELVEALDLRRLVLVGHDWGGPIGAGVGARMPERIAGVVLANTSVLVPRHFRATAFHRLARIKGLSDVVFRGLGFPQNVLWLAQANRRSMRGADGRPYRWVLRRPAARIAPLAMARMVPDSKAHPSMDALRRGAAWLESFEGPMALVWGTRDPLLGRALDRHRRAFPRAPVTLTEAGHFLQEEVPDALAASIRDVWAGAGVVVAETHPTASD